MNTEADTYIGVAEAAVLDDGVGVGVDNKAQYILWSEMLFMLINVIIESQVSIVITDEKLFKEEHNDVVHM